MSRAANEQGPHFPSSFPVSTWLPFAVSRREALPAYISLIKSKAARPHTSDPICGLFCTLPRSVSLLSLSFLPSFLPATRTDSPFVLPLTTTRSLNRFRSPYVRQIIRDRDKGRREYPLPMLSEYKYGALRLNLDEKVIDVKHRIANLSRYVNYK